MSCQVKYRVNQGNPLITVAMMPDNEWHEPICAIAEHWLKLIDGADLTKRDVRRTTDTGLFMQREVREHQLKTNTEYLGIVEETPDGRVAIHLFADERRREEVWNSTTVYTEKSVVWTCASSSSSSSRTGCGW